MKRYSKGQYGYRNYHKRTELLKVFIGAVLIIVQLVARSFADNTAVKNTLTVMAILSVLPTANIAAPLLASWKYHSLPLPLAKKVSSFELDGTVLYDLIISSKEQLLPMDVILVQADEIIAFCTSRQSDARKAEQYLKQMLNKHELNQNVKVFLDEHSFLKRLSSLKKKEEIVHPEQIDSAVWLLKSLSM